MKKFSILTIISDQDLIQFQKKRQEFIRDKVILKEITGVNSIPVQSPSGMGLMQVPYCFIEYEATEQEWKHWVYGTKIIKS